MRYKWNSRRTIVKVIRKDVNNRVCKFVKGLLRNIIRDILPPEPPTHLEWRYYMKVAKGKFSWVPSASSDVKNQTLEVYVNGDLLVTEVFEPAVAEYFVSDLEGGDVLHFKLWSNDGTYDSEVVGLDFTVPDLEAPLAPTGLAFEVVEVTDKVEE